MKQSAAALRHPQMRTPSMQERGLEQALQPQRRLVSSQTAAATTFMSSKIQLTVRLRLKPPLILHLQPNSPPIGSFVAHSSIQLAGGQKRRAARKELFLKLAERILPFSDGDFEPSPPPQLLSRLTDEDLDVAADAVEAVAAKQPKRPSGRAWFRLLAWTVADARGAATPLEKAAAETVGKRLDRQAKKVRGDLEVCENDYRERRLIASDLDHATMDKDHQIEMETLRSEVYIGFHELELSSADEPADALPATLAAALQIAAAPSRHPSQPLPSIPPELARSLGTAGVQYLWDYALDMDWANPGYAIPHKRKSEEWYQLLPSIIQNLLREAASVPSLRSQLDESWRDEEEACKLVDALKEQISLHEKEKRILEGLVRKQAAALGMSDPLVGP